MVFKENEILYENIKVPSGMMFIERYDNELNTLFVTLITGSNIIRFKMKNYVHNNSLCSIDYDEMRRLTYGFIIGHYKN